VLCPSFYRADVIHNPSPWDQFKARMRKRVIDYLQTRRARRQEQLAF
jgi:indolepyruvate ferredoxin oxidoreductase alpha subunit